MEVAKQTITLKLERQVNTENQGLPGAEACGWSQITTGTFKGTESELV